MRIFTGFHAVEENLKSLADKKNRAEQMHIFYCNPGPRIKKILQTAATFGVQCTASDKKDLDAFVKNLPQSARDHRGIVLHISGEDSRAENYVEFDSWLAEFRAASEADNESETDSKKSATVLVLDSITDVHNVGAILRSADQFGASLVLVPQHRGASDISQNEIVARTSAGASNWVKIAIVPNLVRAVQKLKHAGFWVYGADAGGTRIQDGMFAEQCVLIMGSEGGGISRLLREECDSIVSIPTCGRIDSLNVSVATGILLYELFRQKNSR